ncbi:MAG: peptidylprolyl isomerase [Oscillospiraceae bacterium]|nr:peptidylprolyl isomerase [Oscillospiraceae bacterium]
MSASRKKNLNKEQKTAQLTERQLFEQKEAKKLKIYTITFTGVLAVLLVLALVFGVSKFITNNGILERNTVAVTIGEHELSNADLNYYYVDQINEFLNQYGSYASMFGLDLTKPLNEQVTNQETGATWADDFITSAISAAKHNYALIDAAKAAGYELTEEELASIDNNINSLSLYASLYGYTDAESYIRAMYGKGANEKSFREYLHTQALATSYYSHYATSLSYDDAAMKAEDEENSLTYNAYNYNAYYMLASKFNEGGTKDENGTITYSDEEQAAGVKKAEETAKALAEGEYASVEDLDKAIAALPINAESTTAASTAYNDTAYNSINQYIRDWVTASERKAGDVTYLANSSTTTDADGKETTVINGYYVVMFHSVNDNSFPLVNVRHTLIQPEGGTYNSTTGMTDYSEAEMAEAKLEAETLLNEFKAGKATSMDFADMANKHSADGDGTTGGLYEDVVPGQMTASFDAWCFEEGRKAGDTGLVESEYGWHIMYYEGDSETTYREYLIDNALRGADVDAWYTALLEAVKVTEGNTDHMDKALVLSKG